MAFIVFLLAALVAASLVWYSEKRNLEAERSRATAMAEHAHELQRNIEHALSATQALAVLLRREKGQLSDFDRVASQMLPFYPGVGALQLAPGGVIRQSVPLAGNEKAIGHNLLKDPSRTKEAFLARDTGKLTLAGPFPLVQGGLAAAGRLPVFLDDTQGKPYFWGFICVLIKFPDVLNGVQLPQLAAQGYGYELWRTHPDTGNKQVIAASSPAPLADPVHVILEVANATWTMSIAPMKGWSDPLGLAVKLALGLSFSLLLAYLAKLLVQQKAHQQGLENLIAERTREILGARNQLQATLDAIPDFLFELGIDGRCHECHAPHIGLFENLVGKIVDETLPPGVANAMMSALKEAAEVGESHGMQLEWPLPQGNRWFELSVSRKASDSGSPARFIVLAREITKRKRAEEAFKAAEQRFRDMVNATDGIVWEADAATFTFTFISQQAERLLGYPVDDWLQPGFWADHLHPEDMDWAPAYCAACADRLEAHDFEYRAVAKDGRTVWLRDIVTVVAENGKPRWLRGIMVDVTQRKQTEASLRIAAIAFQAQEGMVVTDAATVILRVNRAFSEITGYSEQEAIGQTPRIVNSGRHDSGFYASMWDSITRTGAWQGEIWNRRKNGEVYLEWLTITAVKGSTGEVTNYVGTLTDITRRKEAEDEIQHLAFYDPLTQLPNRRLLLDRLQQALATCSRNEHEGALLFIDLDDFKTLNDTLGHDVGDMLLQQVAQRLSACIREGDTVARVGGDEFVVMLEDLSENQQEAAIKAEAVGEKILAALNQTYRLVAGEHHSTPSIGVTLFGNRQHDTVDELLKRADLAMYQAKAAGRNTLRFFDPDMQSVVSARASMEVDLRQGLRNGEFVLYYQPQVDGEGRLTGVEALVRWQQPTRGMVSPAAFIPLAESTGLILPLGHWVLETACQQLVAWSKLPAMAGISIAVNVSARQFRHRDFVDQVLALLDHTGANPERLKLELTESLLVDDVEDTVAKMTQLKAVGVSFSLDDFGTGYSSLSYLKRLPLDQLKIDQSFVRDMLTNQNDAAIARTIIALGQSLGLAVIAEGVETGEQRNFLVASGCRNFQGYLFGRPALARESELFCQNSQA